MKKIKMNSKNNSLTQKLGISTIHAYRLITSPVYDFFGIKVCKSEPTCSNYTEDAIRKYGIIEGTGKGLVRILRCNPFNKGGYNQLR